MEREKDKLPTTEDNLNISTLNKDGKQQFNKLVDIDTITINKELPIKQRNVEYFKQIKNPERYICNGRLIIKKYNQSGEQFIEAIENIIKLKVEKSSLEH